MVLDKKGFKGRNTLGECPAMAVSEDFLNIEEPPAPKEMEFNWERSPLGEKQKKEETPEYNSAPRRIRARRGAPDFHRDRDGRRTSFDFEDYKKNAYNHLSIFNDQREGYDQH